MATASTSLEGAVRAQELLLSASMLRQHRSRRNRLTTSDALGVARTATTNIRRNGGKRRVNRMDLELHDLERKIMSRIPCPNSQLRNRTNSGENTVILSRESLVVGQKQRQQLRLQRQRLVREQVRELANVGTHQPSRAPSQPRRLRNAREGAMRGSRFAGSLVHDIAQSTSSGPTSLSLEDLKAIVHVYDVTFQGSSLQTDRQELIEGEENDNHSSSSSGECAICLKTLHDHIGRRVAVLPCGQAQNQTSKLWQGRGHAFHWNCVVLWLTRRSAKCPLCRFDFSRHVH